MIDRGLLLSGVVVVLVLLAADRWTGLPTRQRGELFDQLMLPTLAGILFGRVTAAGLDDPTSLRSLRALLVIRGGVEFWPGVLVTILLLALQIRRRRGPVSFGLADVVPYLLWGYAAFEATCLVRDGCYGPLTSFGLRPTGLQSRMFPIGLVVAGVIATCAFVIQRLWSVSPWLRVVLAGATVAGARAVASFWLPSLGPGLSRPHLESLAVAVACLAAAVLLLARRRMSRPPPDGVVTGSG